MTTMTFKSGILAYKYLLTSLVSLLYFLLLEINREVVLVLVFIGQINTRHMTTSTMTFQSRCCSTDRSIVYHHGVQ